METQNLAKKVKEFRALRGMSQEYLAEESRVSLRTIQRIENNESIPTGETMKRIAHALDIKLTELTNSDSTSETHDLRATIVFLKKQRSQTHKKAEIKTFERFITLLEKLKEKDLSDNQKEAIESFIQYLELEKIPSFSNGLFKKKLKKLKKYLKNNIGLIPSNFYTTWAASFGISFAMSFSVQGSIALNLKIAVISAALFLILIGVLLDTRMKKQERSFNF